MSDSQPINNDRKHPPPAEGMRLKWESLPARIRSEVETWLGSPIVKASSQPTGFSPGVAARLVTAAGRSVFVKAVSADPNPTARQMHLKEAKIGSLMPAEAPVPRLLWSYDEGGEGWVVLVFEEIDGWHPTQPWQQFELDRILEMLAQMAEVLTPSPLPDGIVTNASEEFAERLSGWGKLLAGQSALRDQLDPWSARHLEKLAENESKAPAATAGNTLLHFDIRGDNLLLTEDRVWVVDWPLACVGAAWVDIVFFAPSVTMQGGPLPELLIADHPTCREADPAAITAAIVSVAGFFTYQSMLPAPPGLPTLRPFQAAQGEVARAWVAQRTGWT